MSRKTNNAANGNAVSNYDSELAFQYDTEFMDQHTANPNRAIAPTTDTDVMGKNAKTLYAKATIFAKATLKNKLENLFSTWLPQRLAPEPSLISWKATT